jgi:hypothetical protein
MLKLGKKIDMTELFRDEASSHLSHTKFWSNVAYFAATLAFLSLNLFSTTTPDSFEMIWLIYLGVVASNAVANKWIKHKYNAFQTKKQPTYVTEEYADEDCEEIAPKRRKRFRASKIDNPDE